MDNELNDVPVSRKRKAVCGEDPNDDMDPNDGMNKKRKFQESRHYPPLAIRAFSNCRILEVKITNGMKVEEGQVLLVFEKKVTPIFYQHLPTIPEHVISRIRRAMEENARVGVYSLEDVEDSAKYIPTAMLDDGLENFKKFDIVKDHSGHLFAANNSPMNQLSKEWENKMKEEWGILEKDLPETMFVRVYEPRIDLLRVAIIGPKGTPYQDGLFFFDVFFPSTYPHTPPLVRYHSGGLNIHPNVFKCGEVRLSCFQPMMWQHDTWNVLQLLVSIQNLVLTKKPYFIVRREFTHTVDGEKLSLMYNENTLIKSLKTMVYTMNKPPKNFEDLVVGHFRKHVTSILKACQAYTESGYFDSDNCSIKFRNDVAEQIKSLVTAFMRIGAMEAQDFLYLSQKRTPIPPPAPAQNPAEEFIQWHKCEYTAHTSYEVVQVLVEEGTEIKKGDPFFIFKPWRKETPEEAARKAAIASRIAKFAELDAKMTKMFRDLESKLPKLRAAFHKIDGSTSDL